MKRKIRNIYIDGIEKSGKTSVTREIRKFLKNKNKDLHEMNGTDLYKLDQQKSILEDDNISFVLKENSLLQLFQKEMKEKGSGVVVLENQFQDLIRLERDLNHKHGVVHFFIIPEDLISLSRIYDSEDEMPSYVDGIVSFYKNINLYSIAQGLDIRLIPFNEFDKIYDIRDKILKIIKENYEI